MTAFTFEFTQAKLAKILVGNPYVEHWYEALNTILPDYEIYTLQRASAFVAQCAHESGNFRLLKENLNYQASSLTRVWPRLFPADVAAKYAHKPEKIANRAYSNRMGNGPEESGDGWKYCGRGLIQLTGKANYQAFAESLEMKVEDVPEYLGTFEGATQSASWFWETNNLNHWADTNDMKNLTRAINGGYLGLEERISHYNHAMQVLGA